MGTSCAVRILNFSDTANFITAKVSFIALGVRVQDFVVHSLNAELIRLMKVKGYSSKFVLKLKQRFA
jgi:hypothetical protein